MAKHYRTMQNRDNRTMAKLSPRGRTTMNVGLGSLDTFAWISAFRSGIFGGRTVTQFDIEKVSPGFYDLPAINKKLKLFYMSCGTEDLRMPSQKKALDGFQSRGIRVRFAASPGAHDWKVWRQPGRSCPEAIPLGESE